MKIAIVTDTNSGITKHDVTGSNIYIIQIPISINNDTLLDYDAVSNSNISVLLEDSKTKLSTMPLPIIKIKEIWNNLLKNYQYDLIIHIPFSSKMNDSIEILKTVSEGYNGKVLIYETDRIAGALKSLVYSIKNLTKQNIPHLEILKLIDNLNNDFSFYMINENSKYMKNNSSLKMNIQCLYCLKSLKPVITLDKGIFNGVFKSNNYKKSYDKVLKMMDKDIKKIIKNNEQNSYEIYISYGGNIQKGVNLKEYFNKKYPSIVVSYVDSVKYSLTTNLGNNILICGVSRKI